MLNDGIAEIFLVLSSAKQKYFPTNERIDFPIIRAKPLINFSLLENILTTRNSRSIDFHMLFDFRLLDERTNQQTFQLQNIEELFWNLLWRRTLQISLKTLRICLDDDARAADFNEQSYRNCDEAVSMVG
jgi:hypothetical protein